MLQMVYEKEVVLNIRHRIEIYEQERHFGDNALNDTAGDTTTAFKDSHIHLGSCQHCENYAVIPLFFLNFPYLLQDLLS